MVRHNVADDCRIAAKRVAAHRREHLIRILGRHDGNELAFIGNIERVKSQHLASSVYFATDRDRCLREPDAYSRAHGQFV